MALKITYKVGGMPFTAVADNIAQAYEYIQAIIKANSVNFPRQEETLSDYMAILANFKSGQTLGHENFTFKIEVDKSEDYAQHLAEAYTDAEATLLKLYGTGGKYCDGVIDSYRERVKAREAVWSNG